MLRPHPALRVDRFGSCLTPHSRETHLIRIAASGLDASRVPSLRYRLSRRTHGPAVKALRPRAEMLASQMERSRRPMSLLGGRRHRSPGSRPQPRRAGPSVARFTRSTSQQPAGHHARMQRHRPRWRSANVSQGCMRDERLPLVRPPQLRSRRTDSTGLLGAQLARFSTRHHAGTLYSSAGPVTGRLPWGFELSA